LTQVSLDEILLEQRDVQVKVLGWRLTQIDKPTHVDPLPISPTHNFTDVSGEVDQLGN